MEDLLKQYPTKEAFDRFFEQNYQPVLYCEAGPQMEELIREAGLEIFFDDYVKEKRVSKRDFKEHLSQAANFRFEEAMTEAYYEKNPEIYEAAFGLYELAGAKSAGITETFHVKYKENYEALLDELYDTVIAGLR